MDRILAEIFMVIFFLFLVFGVGVIGAAK